MIGEGRRGDGIWRMAIGRLVKVRFGSPHILRGHSVGYPSINYSAERFCNLGDSWSDFGKARPQGPV